MFHHKWQYGDWEWIVASVSSCEMDQTHPAPANTDFNNNNNNLSYNNNDNNNNNSNNLSNTNNKISEIQNGGAIATTTVLKADDIESTWRGPEGEAGSRAWVVQVFIIFCCEMRQCLGFHHVLSVASRFSKKLRHFPCFHHFLWHVLVFRFSSFIDTSLFTFFMFIASYVTYIIYVQVFIIFCDYGCVLV